MIPLDTAIEEARKRFGDLNIGNNDLNVETMKDESRGSCSNPLVEGTSSVSANFMKDDSYSSPSQVSNLSQGKNQHKAKATKLGQSPFISDQMKQEIGFAGEKAIYELLFVHYKNKRSGNQLQETDFGFEGDIYNKHNYRLHLSVTWWNKKMQFSTRDHDIEVKKGSKTRYIEVKSTTSSLSTSFFMSRNEFELMKRQNSNYQIYRVYNLDLNTDKCNYKHKKYKNPADSAELNYEVMTYECKPIKKSPF